MAVMAGCSSARDVVPLPIETASLSLAEPRTFGSTDAAARGIAAILTREFGLPLPARINVFVYPERQAFQRGLVLEAGLGPARAAELSDFAVGIGGRGQLLLNQGGRDLSGREWLRLIAHELTVTTRGSPRGAASRGRARARVRGSGARAGG
jgi:hypothetical protein